MNLKPNEITSHLLDLDSSKHERFKVTDNHLMVAGAGSGIGWFSDSCGSFLFEEIRGNILIETEVHIVKKDDGKSCPGAQFSSAGLLFRDTTSAPGKQRWVMYNIGFQNTFYGREIKVTRPSKGFRMDMTYLMGLRSLSTLYLIPGEHTPVRLRLARIGDEIRAFHFFEGAWKEEVPTSGMEVMGNGIKYPVEQFNSTSFRPCGLNLPQRIQAGIITNPGMDIRNPFRRYRDSMAEFSYYISRGISSFNECLKI